MFYQIISENSPHCLVSLAQVNQDTLIAQVIQTKDSSYNFLNVPSSLPPWNWLCGTLLPVNLKKKNAPYSAFFLFDSWSCSCKGRNKILFFIIIILSLFFYFFRLLLLRQHSNAHLALTLTHSRPHEHVFFTFLLLAHLPSLQIDLP